MSFVNLMLQSPREWMNVLGALRQGVEDHTSAIEEKQKLLDRFNVAIEDGYTSLTQVLLHPELVLIAEALEESINRQAESREKCQEGVDEIQTYLNNLAQAESEEE